MHTGLRITSRGGWIFQGSTRKASRQSETSWERISRWQLRRARSAKMTAKDCSRSFAQKTRMVTRLRVPEMAAKLNRNSLRARFCPC
jgi:hypothetical protein